LDPTLNAARGARLRPQPGAAGRVCGSAQPKEKNMRGPLLWLIGIPIPVIIALYLFGVL
jgi:hypothetical protein